MYEHADDHAGGSKDHADSEEERAASIISCWRASAARGRADAQCAHPYCCDELDANTVSTCTPSTSESVLKHKQRTGVPERVLYVVRAVS